MKMEDELYKAIRPKIFKYVFGQDKAVHTLSSMVKEKRIPHFLLFTGPSGCGKTTLARILANKLNCTGSDLVETNAANYRGVDSVRDIAARMHLKPMKGGVRIWIIDEAQQLTTAAQNAFLKILEDPPSHVYFFFATTDPHKLLKTVITRATQIELGLLSPESCNQLVSYAEKKLGVEFSEDVREGIFEQSEGSARKALVLLDQIRSISDPKEQLQALTSIDLKPIAIDLVKKLMNPKTSWKELASMLRKCEDEPETIRRIVLGFATNNLLAGRMPDRSYVIIDAFIEPFYESGKAKLAAACWEVMNL